ncbi:hypothetical protein FPV67DRAFT_1781065 [Lyophyllum atratum]|nr:hypothetical protein FPV67DRAFT_1781065 [Lyophyllum atratum]
MALGFFRYIYRYFSSTESEKEAVTGQLHTRETQGPAIHLNGLLNDCVPVYDQTGGVIGYVHREQIVALKIDPKPVLDNISHASMQAPKAMAVMSEVLYRRTTHGQFVPIEQPGEQAPKGSTSVPKCIIRLLKIPRN